MKPKALDIQTVMRDSNGITWIGTLGQGLIRVQAGVRDESRIEKYSQLDGLSAARVWSFLEDREHNIWVGTQNGLNRFRDEKIATLTRREGLATDVVNALGSGSDGTIWASTSMGINRIDGGHRELYLKGDHVMGLSTDRGNNLWAGTNRGVVRMENGKWSNLPIPAGMQLQDVTALTADPEKGMWLFDVRRGLHHWANGEINDFSNEPLLKGKTIVAATTRPGGTLRQFRRQLGRERASNTAPGVARSAASSNLNWVTSWPSSIGVPVVSPTRI